MHRATANNPSELQKRYTERARLKAEEKDLNKMIEKTKAQLIQLQVEALDIKSRIRSTSQKADKKKDAVKFSQGADNVRADEHTGYEEEERQLELDLSTNNDVLEKMMRGNFSTSDLEEHDEAI